MAEYRIIKRAGKYVVQRFNSHQRSSVDDVNSVAWYDAGGPYGQLRSARASRGCLVKRDEGFRYDDLARDPSQPFEVIE